MVSVTRSKGVHRERRAAAAQRVLNSTEALLRSGERFTEIPVERILAAAAVSRSTFYVHFADKSVLLAQLAERALADVTASAEMWWQMDHTVGPEPAAKTIRGMIKTYRKHAPVLRALNEVSSYDDAAHGLWRKRTDEYIAKTVKRMSQEQADGIIPAGVDVEYAASTIIRLIDVALMDHMLHGSPRNDARLADSLARSGWLARYGRIPDSGARAAS